jgi:hypothetical protein
MREIPLMFGSMSAPTRLVRFGRIALAAGLIVTAYGCASAPPKSDGSFRGGAGGASAGVTASTATSNAGRGALIGGSVGLIGGGLQPPPPEPKPQPAPESEEPRRQISDARSPAGQVTRDDIVAWTRQGRTDEVIIDRIERSDAVFRPTAGDETDLRQQGVSDNVLSALRQTPRR